MPRDLRWCEEGKGLMEGHGKGERKDVEREMRVGLDACRKGGHVYL